MAHVAPPSSFTTGMTEGEQHSFTWTIENFSVLRNFKSMIDAQKIYFSVGSKLGRPSTWCVYLKEYTIRREKSIAILFKVKDPPASDPIWKNVLAEMTSVTKGENRSRTEQLEVATDTRNYAGWILPAEQTQRQLVINLAFKLYVPSQTTEACQPTLEALQVQFATQANKELLLLKYPSPGKKIKIISKDKKEFFVHKEILEVQSPILKAMLKNDKLEANSGVLKFSDISSRGLEVILTFLSTGEFHPDWSDPKVVVELTYAAAKYQLQDLLKFLDATLGKICQVENVLALFTLAHDYSLKKAEVELLKFIQGKGSSSPEVYSKMQNGISVPRGRAAVVTLPKDKSRWTLGMLFTKNGRKK